MSNNKNNQTNRGLLDTQRTGANTQYQDFLKGTKNSLDTSRTEASGLRSQIASTYSDQSKFMPSGLTPNASGWFDLSGSGGESTGGGGAAGGDFSSAKSGYQKFADTGGADDYADALGGYKNFASTGGIGDSEAQAIRNRATDQIPSFYDAYKRNAQRRANVQGGYAPGFDAQMSEIGRQAGREGFNASRQVEGDIADKRQQGRMFGVTGQGDVASKISSNKLTGLGGLTNVGGMEQQNNQFNAGLGESRASRNQQMQLALQQMYQQGGLSSAQGLQSLYSSAPGDVGQNQNAWLSGMSGKTGNDLSNLGIRSGIQDKNFWTDTLPGLIGAGGGIAAGFAGGRSNHV